MRYDERATSQRSEAADDPSSSYPRSDAPDAAPPTRGARSRTKPTIAAIAPVVVFGVVIGLALFLFVVWWRTRKNPMAVEAAIAPARTSSAAPRTSVAIDDDPERLAQTGDFDGAIQQLLLRALRLVGWTPFGDGDSFTAREVVASVPVPDPRRTPLASLVAMAELLRFGGVRPGPAEFKAMKSAFQLLERSLA